MPYGISPLDIVSRTTTEWHSPRSISTVGGGPVADGWSQVVQDTRVFPGIVLSGKAHLDRICFIFKGKNGPSNITLGKMVLTSNTSFDTALMNAGGCELSVPCVAK